MSMPVFVYLASVAGQSATLGSNHEFDLSSGHNNGEPLYPLEAGVTAHKSCLDGEGGRSDPAVVLVERHAAALLSHLQARVQITSGWWDRFTGQCCE